MLTDYEIKEILAHTSEITTSVSCEEVTRNGMFGGPCDYYRVFVPGLRSVRFRGRVLAHDELRQLERAAQQ